MFDLVRAAAFAWVLVVLWRARAYARGAAAVAGLFLYVLGLEIASGLSARGHGLPVPPLLLASLGPSSLQRAALPPLPLSALVAQWPAMAHFLAGAVLGAQSRRVRAASGRAPSAGDARLLVLAARGFALLAAFEAFCAVVHLFVGPLGPDFADADLHE